MISLRIFWLSASEAFCGTNFVRRFRFFGEPNGWSASLWLKGDVLFWGHNIKTVCSMNVRSMNFVRGTIIKTCTHLVGILHSGAGVVMLPPTQQEMCTRSRFLIEHCGYCVRVAL